MRFTKRIIPFYIMFLWLMIFILCNKTFAQEVKITSPLEGSTILGGESVTIIVEASNIINFKSLTIACPLGIKTFSTSPFKWDIAVPEDKIGSFSIGVVGEDLKGEFFYDETTLIVKSQVPLESISVSPQEIYFRFPEEKVQIGVLGIYSNGKTAYISPSGMGTDFVSSDTSVAIVDENGLVTAKGNGNCKISISNNGKSVVIPVEVSIPEFVQATINIEPKILYLKNKKEPISCYIELPQDYYIQDINLETLSLNEAISCEVSSAQIGDYNNNGIADLTVKFVRQDLWYVLERGEQVSVAISGKIGNKYFRGTDVIKVLNEAPTVPFTQFSLTTPGAYFIDGTYRESFASNLAYNFTTNTATGSLKCNFISARGRASVQTTSVTSASVPEQGTVAFSGACTVNSAAGYSYTAAFKDVANPGAGKDIVSITITGPNNYKLEFLNKTIVAGDIAISIQ